MMKGCVVPRTGVRGEGRWESDEEGVCWVHEGELIEEEERGVK